MLVESVEHPRRPAAVALEQPDPQLREALQHATAVRLAVTAMMPIGWPNVCHIIMVSKISSVKSGRSVVLPAAVEADRHAESLALAQIGS